MRQETGLFLPRRGTSVQKLTLLVEDDLANAELFKHILTEEAHYYVFWVRNGRAAGKDLTLGIRPSHLEDMALIPSESQSLLLLKRVHQQEFL